MYVVFAQLISIIVFSAHQTGLPVANVLQVINWILEHAQTAKQDFITLELTVKNAHRL